MNTFKEHISILTALFVAFGIITSSIHIHFDDHHHSETVHTITQEADPCIICVSVLKVSSNSSVSVHSEIFNEHFYPATQTGITSSDSVRLNNGRSPPLLKS
ncbi:MAG: hypothetical protein EA391_05340 [Balneolaceae bacterium]|nr:MAG: hypothetical protein EA391_05340 [Balneolaceae bacterium]